MELLFIVAVVVVDDQNLPPSLHNSLPPPPPPPQAPRADFEPPPVWKSQAGLVISSAGDKRRRRGRGVYLLVNTEGDDECGRYQADASQPLIKRRFDDATRDNGLSVSPSPAASRLLSLEQRASVGGWWGGGGVGAGGLVDDPDAGDSPSPSLPRLLPPFDRRSSFPLRLD